MRPIKFRAWDGRRFGYFQIDSDRITFPVLEYFGHIKSDGEIRFPGFEAWQQFTGLHDKNGREIYEGDIIEITIANGAGRERGEIVFESKKGRFGMRDGFVVWGLDTDDKANEVIGNIYEHPELLP